MAAYSGNVLRMNAPQDARINPGRPDESHDMPTGPEGVPDRRAEEISVPADMGAEYAGTTMEDGIPRAIMAGQPGLGWNPADASMMPVGGGGTPAGYAPAWGASDPHNAGVDTSFASSARGAIAGSPYMSGPAAAHSAGNDTLPYSHANPVGTDGTRYLEREVDFPKEMWAEPSGPGADKFVAGTNSYASSNPEGDQYTGRWGARVHYGFDTEYFVHQPMYIDHTPQTYDRRTAPITARDPLVGGSYPRTPSMGQLAANPWLSELGGAADVGTYGVPVDGSI